MAAPSPLVHVRLPRHLTVGWAAPSRLDVQAESFASLLAALDDEVPGLSRRLVDDQGVLRQHLLLFVNEQRVTGDAERLALQAGDRVLFVASVSGG